MSEENAGLPAAWYTRPEIFARERRAIFAGAWQLLGRRDQLSKPGDYLAATLGGWSVFAMLDDAGQLGAFQNVCRHQGLPVLDAGGGNCEMLRCRYHGWTYDLQGRFTKAPPAVAPADPADPLHHLVRVGAATAAGLIFVRIDGDNPLDAAPDIDLPGLRFTGHAANDIDANWKLVVETLLGGSDGFRWSWPTLVIRSSDDGAVVYQVTPRAFRRTRLVAHLYADAAHDGTAMVERANRTADEAKASCEAQQRAFESGGAARPTEPRLAQFHAQLRTAHAAIDTSRRGGN
ncbi:MAG TPA: aromatic ring-hydroxylating dioxygenase subunit alpha [Stellaceae bacterium]|nr:aromatic ring-hydroxylating dioxygenase subunit alpha [Stellaceae bacterium]